MYEVIRNAETWCSLEQEKIGKIYIFYAGKCENIKDCPFHGKCNEDMTYTQFNTKFYNKESV